MAESEWSEIADLLSQAAEEEEWYGMDWLFRGGDDMLDVDQIEGDPTEHFQKLCDEVDTLLAGKKKEGKVEKSESKKNEGGASCSKCWADSVDAAADHEDMESMLLDCQVQLEALGSGHINNIMNMVRNTRSSDTKFRDDLLSFLEDNKKNCEKLEKEEGKMSRDNSRNEGATSSITAAASGVAAPPSEMQEEPAPVSEVGKKKDSKFITS